MDLAATYARFAHDLTFGDIPIEVVDTAKTLILDQLGVMLVGSAAAGVEPLLNTARACGGKGEATVLVHGDRLPAAQAALVNGTMARAHDFDSLHEAAIIHVTAGCLPQCLAIAERHGGVSGREFLTAMIAGMEIMIRLGASFETSFLHTGRVTTLHLATFGGALAGAKLLRLDPRAIVSALGLAYGQVAGNLQVTVEGTVLVRVLQGMAAQSAVQSAVLAQAGLVGPERVFQGEFGYFKSYHDHAVALDGLTRDLGRRYRVPEISIKSYPCCFLAHFAIDAMRQLVAEGLRAADIAAVHVRVTQAIYNVVCAPLDAKRAPANPQEALFSLPFTVAAAAVHGHLRLEHMTPEAIADPAVRALAGIVTVAVDPELERTHSRGVGVSIVEVTRRDGGQVSRRVEVVKGHPSLPMRFDECAEKFWNCARYAARPLDRDRLEAAIEQVRQLESVEDVTTLIQLLA